MGRVCCSWARTSLFGYAHMRLSAFLLLLLVVHWLDTATAVRFMNRQRAKMWKHTVAPGGRGPPRWLRTSLSNKLLFPKLVSLECAQRDVAGQATSGYLNAGNKRKKKIDALQ
jgi:hypothetical protein